MIISTDALSVAICYAALCMAGPGRPKKLGEVDPATQRKLNFTRTPVGRTVLEGLQAKRRRIDGDGDGDGFL